MPSSFSSTDGCQDFVLDDYLVPDDLLRDIEIFADHVNRLRIALDSSSYVPDGESKCVQVKAALSMVSQSVRDLLVRYPLFKTTQVLIPTSHLVHSVKEINFSDVVIDTSKTLSCIDKLEGAVGNTLKQSLNVQNNMQQVDKNKKDSSSVNRLSGKYSTPAMSSTPPCPSSKIPLIRRHSTFKGKVSSENQGPINAETLDARLANHDDGLNVAFECTKTQGKHFKDITAYIKKRITLEQEHATKLTALTKETRSVLRNDCHLPLLQNFFYCFETDLGLCEKVNNIFNALMEKIKESEKNRDDEELFKRSLKNEVAKDIKQLKDFENELVKARNNFLAKEDNFKKAKNAYIRIEKNLISSSYSMESKRNIKEIDKKKRSEEDAMNKMEDAENQVKKLESEMRRKFLSLEKSKKSTISHLRELIFNCDHSTKICSQHYFQALSELWESLPNTYQELTDATRSYTPGTEYMSFLQNLPGRQLASPSNIRNDEYSANRHSQLNFGSSSNEIASGDHTTTASSSASSIGARRRNAINLSDHHAVHLAHNNTAVRRQPKKSRLFNFPEPSEAAKSHKLTRVRQPTKCSLCETLSLLSTYQCTSCDTFYHKTCLSRIVSFCNDNSSRNGNYSEVRRVSIFGVPLQGHLHEHSRKVPFILERCIREIEEHGMKYKGIYRTCGVKSKIEAICENFEKISHSSQIDLSEVHPMNVASVIKLYFRKLPEPLMTFELYGEWIRIAGILDDAKPEIKEIVECCDRLPLANYNTFKYLLLHLNRVTWFEEDNLMNAANLANVISPSLLWIKPPPSANRKKASNSKDKKPVIDHTLLYSDAHVQTKTLEYLIKYAFQIFCEDYEKDRKDFFDRYVDEEVKKEEEPGDEEKKLIEDIVLDLNDDDEDPFGSDPDFDADDDSREAANSSKKSLNALASTPEGHQQVSTDFNFMDANDFTVDVLDQYLSQNFAILNSKTECGSNSKSQIPQSYYLGKTLVTPQSEKRSMYTQSAPMAENSSGSRSTLKDEDQKESPDSLYNKHESILRNTSLPVDYPQASNKNDSPKEVQ